MEGGSSRRASGKFGRLTSFSGKFRSLGKDMARAGKGFSPNMKHIGRGSLPTMLRRRTAGAAAGADAGQATDSQAVSEEEMATLESLLSDLALESEGSQHTHLIVAKSGGRMVGGLSDAALVHLTWYRATAEGIFQILPGVQGGFYQPSAADTGSRICVQCNAVKDPSLATFAEIGPVLAGATAHARPSAHFPALLPPGQRIAHPAGAAAQMSRSRRAWRPPCPLTPTPAPQAA